MTNLYGSRWIGYGYDLLASVVWLPSKDKLYNTLVSLLNIQPNETVLELGCGTGFLTKKLAAQNAIVTSIDQSYGMLARAREKVPQGKFIQADILQYKDVDKFDYVVLFFVLHELSADDRIAILKSAKNFLKKNGEIVICDFSIPEKGIMKTLFPRLIGLWENKHTLEILKNGFYTEIVNNDLAIQSNTKLHQQRVQLIKLKLT
jgi:ubiquinone/menaquinone biosynthesis C-methylase UbiE